MADLLEGKQIESHEEIDEEVDTEGKLQKDKEPEKTSRSMGGTEEIRANREFVSIGVSQTLSLFRPCLLLPDYLTLSHSARLIGRIVQRFDRLESMGSFSSPASISLSSSGSSYLPPAFSLVGKSLAMLFERAVRERKRDELLWGNQAHSVNQINR